MSTKQRIKSGYGYEIYTDYHNLPDDSLTVEFTEHAVLYAGMSSTPSAVRAELVLTLAAACDTGLITEAELLAHFGQNNLNKMRQTQQLGAKHAYYTDTMGIAIARNEKRALPKPQMPIVQDDGANQQTVVRAVQGYTLYAMYCKDGRAAVRLQMEATPSPYIRHHEATKSAKPALELDVFELKIQRLDDGLARVEFNLSLPWMRHLGWVSQQWVDEYFSCLDRFGVRAHTRK